jgi:serine/threonine-protein kinase RsbW
VSAPADRLELPSTLDVLGEAREWIADHARAAGFEGTDILDLELVITEAVSNVVRHAYGGQPGHVVELEAGVRGDALVVRIADHGVPLGSEPRALDRENAGGYGLDMIGQIVDSIDRSADEEGNTLILIKSLPGGST